MLFRCAVSRVLICGVFLSVASFLRASPSWAESWGQKLGWPQDAKVIILHADDIGMCYEANQAAKESLTKGHIQSAALMVPCPWYNEMSEWYQQNPEFDLGLHLTLTSEWKWYRWGPVADRDRVRGLIDKDGYLYKTVLRVATSARPSEVEAEIRAQIEKAIRVGPRPGHIDTHMGTLYARPDYTQVYLKVAEEYRIPAMVIEMSDEVVAKFRRQGYPISKQLIDIVQKYKLPKLDDFHSVPSGGTYEGKKMRFFDQVKSMKPGIHEIIFHPSVESAGLRKITNSWQQRVWEAKMFADPEVRRFFQIEGVEFTNWKEIMKRFEARNN